MSNDYQGRAGSSNRNGDCRLQQVARKKTRVAPKRPRLSSMGALGQLQQVAASNSVGSLPRYSQQVAASDYYRPSRAANETHQQLVRADNPIGTSSPADLQYQSTGLLNYQYHQHHQYSSSQAQLQSLTSPPIGSFLSCDTLRKTPKNGANQHHKQQRHQQALSRSQMSLAPTTSTKPMTSMLNEPSTSATIERRQRSMVSISAAGGQSAHQLPLSATPNHGAALLPAGAHNMATYNHPLPPPYSAGDAPNLAHQLPQQPSSGQQSHVICYQPVQASSAQHQSQQQVPPANATTNDHTNQSHRIAATSGRTSQQTMPGSASSFPALATQNNGQILNLLNNQQAGNFPTSFSQQQQQQQPTYSAFLLNNIYQHQAHLSEQQAAQQLGGGNCANQQFPFAVATNISKSKSCLTCADISIKWYIVVIALLGLICALIGTIVGAAHSVGRDYISLALLLIGVGLVLVAISWVALRLTIKTYKTSAADRLHQHHQLGLNLNRCRLRQPTIGRLFGAQSAAQVGTTSGLAVSASSAGLHRSLLNERLYFIAAALSARQAANQSGELREQSSTPENVNGGLLSGIKQRFARLIASPSSGGPSTAAAADNHLSGSRRLTASTCPIESGSPNELAGQSSPHLNVLLQQYQVAQQQQQPALLFGGPMPLPPHLFGLFPPLPPGSPDFPFRPPPPSYSASMQDQRLRMLLAERAGLQQQLSALTQQQQQQQANPLTGCTSAASTITNPAPTTNTAPTSTSGSPREQALALGGAPNNNAPTANPRNLGEPLQPAPGCSPKPEAARDARTQQAAPPLKPSSSAPSIGALVTANDIYVPSSSPESSSSPTRHLGADSVSSPTLTCPSDSRPLPGSRAASTIVNIGATTAVVSGHRDPAGARAHNQAKASSATHKGEVKILGYL